ncbi:MAG: ADP-ribosylglycohydrolase family protein [Elusimicrobia bacterium]|nr:ADP-ribosylglycohydrolase family protein [Elusimicrobiota bacterium]
MLGAIAGDIIGSVFEGEGLKRADFDLFSPFSTFTDDTVLTVAVADCILNDRPYAETFKRYVREHPERGYGGRFLEWAASSSMAPINSFGNGSAMRASPAGFAFSDEAAVLAEARRSAEVTYDHPEGVKGAQAVALAVFLARTSKDKKLIKAEVERRFGYDLTRSLDQIRPGYRFDATCQGSVPESILAFIESSGFEDAVRKAVSLGGDADTMACIAGGIAQAYYGSVPEPIAQEALMRLPPRFRDILEAFNAKYGL